MRWMFLWLIVLNLFYYVWHQQQAPLRVTEIAPLNLVQSMDAAAGVDYWVYLPPLASRQASLRQLRELQARKIDSYIITQGDLANGISLGIFPRSDSAQSVMQRLRDAGYEPSLRELTRAHRSFWVRISPQSRRLADDSVLQRLAFDFKGLEQQLMPCEGVARAL